MEPKKVTINYALLCKELEKQGKTKEKFSAELGRSAYGFEIDRNFYRRATEEMLAYERDEQMSIEDFITEE